MYRITNQCKDTVGFSFNQYDIIRTQQPIEGQDLKTDYLLPVHLSADRFTTTCDVWSACRVPGHC